MIAKKMSEVHNCLIETLFCFDDICKRNNIEYFLEGGSLLGAVRYGDLIPWDDDVDVEMTRSEFNKLKNLPRSEFPEGFELFDPQGLDERFNFIPEFLNKNHQIPLHKLESHKEEELGYVNIDIFVLDETKNKFTHLIQSLSFIFLQLVNENHINYREKIHLHKKYRLLYVIMKIFAKITSLFLKPKGVLKLHKFFSEHYNGKDCKLYFPSDSMMVYQLFDKEWYSSRDVVPMRGKNIWTMKGYRSYLEFCYGEDYITPPPIEERVTQHCNIELDIPIE